MVSENTLKTRTPTSSRSLVLRWRSPNLAAQAIEAGAGDVQFIGCPPEDCANREGNTWLNDRVSGERLPKLKQNFIPLIHTAWVAPTDFGKAINSQIKSERILLLFAPNQIASAFYHPPARRDGRCHRISNLAE
jgi:hypothetical protein